MNSYARLQHAMAESDVSAVLLTDMLNIRWLTGFTGSSGVVLATQSQGVFITDSRYTIQAGQEVEGFPVVSFASPRSLDDVIEEEAKKLGINRISFETSLSYSAWKTRADKLSAFEWVESPELVKDLRMVKTDGEVEKIQAACVLADKCLEHVVRLIKPGVAEYDINLEVEFFYRRNGAALAFEPIVVSGPNSARPHGHASERKLQRGDFVTIDCGGKLNGYNSDITRTFVVGEASTHHEEVYNQVLKAQVASIEALKPGTDGVAVDTLARNILAEKGLDGYFGHGLGHGLGLAVHDPGGLSQRSPNAIVAGQVWTVEPGVYIEGFGGVRIEDDVLVTAGEPRILTHFPKELTVL